MTDARQKEMAHRARWIASQIGAGVPEPEIIQALIGQGVPQEQATVWVQRVGAGVRQGHIIPADSDVGGGRLAAFMGGRVAKVLGVVLVFGVLNGGLYVGQDFLARDDVARAEQLEAELARLDDEIDDLEVWLDEQEARSAQIDRLGQELGSMPQSGRYYDASLRGYNAQVDAWNRDLPGLQRIAATYDSLVTDYNATVDEYNVVAKAAYTRWWLLPVAAPGRGGRGAARAARGAELDP